jgi:hypothetical protein
MSNSNSRKVSMSMFLVATHLHFMHLIHQSSLLLVRPMKLDYMVLVNQFLKSSEGIWSTFIFKFSTFLRVDIWIDLQSEAPAQVQA